MYKLIVQTSSTIKIRNTLYESATYSEVSNETAFETLFTMGKLHLFKKDSE